MCRFCTLFSDLIWKLHLRKRVWECKWLFQRQKTVAQMWVPEAGQSGWSWQKMCLPKQCTFKALITGRQGWNNSSQTPPPQLSTLGSANVQPCSLLSRPWNRIFLKYYENFRTYIIYTYIYHYLHTECVYTSKLLCLVMTLCSKLRFFLRERSNNWVWPSFGSLANDCNSWITTAVHLSLRLKQMCFSSEP